MHIFISYAKVDTQPIALKIRDALRSVNGLTAWMDESLESGEDWAVQIQDEIDHCDLMLVLMSPDVNRATEPRSFVLREIHYAQDSQKPILPIMAQKTRIPVQLAGIQFVDLTQNQAAGIEGLVENVCRRVGIPSPTELKRQVEEAERQRVAEIHRQTVEAEQKRQAQIAAQRQAEEEERRRQAQIDAQRRADEQARQQQNTQTAPSIPVMQPRPNAPQDWNKQYSEGSSAAYEAKVRVAGPSKSKGALPLLAGGAVLAALIIIVIVGILLSGVLSEDDKSNANDGVGRYLLEFSSNQTVNFTEGETSKLCLFHNITLGDSAVGKLIDISWDNWAENYYNLVEPRFMRSYAGKFQKDKEIQYNEVEAISHPWTVTEAGEYVFCFLVYETDYEKVKDFSTWINVTLTSSN